MQGAAALLHAVVDFSAEHTDLHMEWSVKLPLLNLFFSSSVPYSTGCLLENGILETSCFLHPPPLSPFISGLQSAL